VVQPSVPRPRTRRADHRRVAVQVVRVLGARSAPQQGDRGGNGDRAVRSRCDQVDLLPRGRAHPVPQRWTLPRPPRRGRRGCDPHRPRGSAEGWRPQAAPRPPRGNCRLGNGGGITPPNPRNPKGGFGPPRLWDSRTISNHAADSPLKEILLKHLYLGAKSGTIP